MKDIKRSFHDKIKFIGKYHVTIYTKKKDAKP